MDQSCLEWNKSFLGNFGGIIKDFSGENAVNPRQRFYIDFLPIRRRYTYSICKPLYVQMCCVENFPSGLVGCSWISCHQKKRELRIVH